MMFHQLTSMRPMDSTWKHTSSFLELLKQTLRSTKLLWVLNLELKHLNESGKEWTQINPLLTMFNHKTMVVSCSGPSTNQLLELQISQAKILSSLQHMQWVYFREIILKDAYLLSNKNYKNTQFEIDRIK